MTSRLPPLGLLRALALATVCVGLSVGCADETPKAEVGAALPEFVLSALDGKQMSSREFATGVPTVLNFWATWCQPCRKEMPELQSLAQSSNIQVIGIALDEEGAAAVRPFVERHGITYPILLGNQEIFQRLGGYAIPYTLMLDAEGKITDLYRGPITEQEIRQSLATSKAGKP